MVVASIEIVVTGGVKEEDEGEEEDEHLIGIFLSCFLHQFPFSLLIPPQTHSISS